MNGPGANSPKNDTDLDLLWQEPPVLQYHVKGLPIRKQEGDLVTIFIAAADHLGPVTLKLVTTKGEVHRFLREHLGLPL